MSKRNVAHQSQQGDLLRQHALTVDVSVGPSSSMAAGENISSPVSANRQSSSMKSSLVGVECSTTTYVCTGRTQLTCMQRNTEPDTHANITVAARKSVQGD